MKAEMRRKEILARLSKAVSPISASRLAEDLGVSRQVIVQDIALLRAKGESIASLSRGYVLEKKDRFERIFKIHHTNDEVSKELNLIVDAGGTVVDVFIYHKVYGTVRAPMNISNRLQVNKFLSDIASGKSSLLMNVTSGYHYHTVRADNENTLVFIENSLREHGFLAPLQEYEPNGVSK
jgi:transcriptional regulator of NAD metabolism